MNAAERQLIEHWSPCFNAALNSQPTPIPPLYRPLNASLRCGRSLHKLIREAERVVKAEDAALWAQEQA